MLILGGGVLNKPTGILTHTIGGQDCLGVFGLTSWTSHREATQRLTRNTKQSKALAGNGVTHLHSEKWSNIKYIAYLRRRGWTKGSMSAAAAAAAAAGAAGCSCCCCRRCCCCRCCSCWLLLLLVAAPAGCCCCLAVAVATSCWLLLLIES